MQRTNYEKNFDDATKFCLNLQLHSPFLSKEKNENFSSPGISFQYSFEKGMDAIPRNIADKKSLRIYFTVNYQSTDNRKIIQLHPLFDSLILTG